MNKIKEELLKKLQNTYCQIQPSPIHGVGIFALRNIPKAVDVFYGASASDGEIFTREEIQTLPGEVQQFIYDFLVSNQQGDVEIPPNGITGLDMSFYLNHSNNPNLETFDEGETFITKHEIKKGEELTVDYKTFDSFSEQFKA